MSGTIAVAGFGGETWPQAALVVDHIRGAVGCSDHEARVKLQFALRNELVFARGPIGDWSTSHIPADFWRLAFPDEDCRAFNIETLVRLSWFEVRAKEVFDRWPAKQQTVESEMVVSTATLLPPPHNTGGRPPKYDWPGLMAALSARLYEDGCPAPGEQAELERWAASWFPIDGQPTESHIRIYVAKAVAVRKALDARA